MKRLLLLPSLLLSGLAVFAGTITVKNTDELREADKKAQPGDVIVLADGEWANVGIKLTCKGTKEKPITFTAQTAGRVLVTGHSFLKIGGEYIVVKGLYFQKGYAGDDAVIDFRINKNSLANNCRVTECAIIDFNNPKRMDENYWISFYGKNNRLDHNTFRGKKNMGVMIAVILDDERSRENFHSIDHNFFNGRPPLASNSGEIIRVGVSQHCQFNSNTQITDNYFEKCDGETEIVSIKSGSNLVKNNIFRECQGGVVLRHGDNNTVTDNQFLGNYKEGTGGVRVINKGQWVVNNLFYACRGIDFRSPLSIMNGIPNSPANRYVQVTDAVVANNTFIDCSAASFCEGSDAERTLPPANVFLVNNWFYNKKDSTIYKTSDNTDGFSFIGNAVSTEIRQPLFPGFQKASLVLPAGMMVPQISAATRKKINSTLPDSLQQEAVKRLGKPLTETGGFDPRSLALRTTGAAWLTKEPTARSTGYTTVNCKTAEEVYKQLERTGAVIITLTGTSYTLDRGFAINKTVEIRGNKKGNIRFITPRIPAVFMVNGGGSLTLRNLFIDGSDIKAGSLVCSDTSGSSDHFNFAMYKSGVTNLDRANGCESIFTANKSTVADSLVIRDNVFSANKSHTILMADEKDNKGYYNAEKIYIAHNNFTGQQGVLLNIYRGGNDESTMGPQLFFSHNKITDCSTADKTSLLQLTGVQQTTIFSNNFYHSNPGATLITYKDIVRARHLLEKNSVAGSGKIEENGFVVKRGNVVE